MKKKILYSLTVVVALILFINVFNDSTSIKNIISSLNKGIHDGIIDPIIFVGLWIVRLVAAIPGVTLMVLGGLIFSPGQAIIYSLIGLVISDSLVFLLGKSRLFKGFKNKLIQRHGDMMSLIEKYNYKFLALGVLCPVAPTDVICYFSAYLGIGYIKYIVIFILSNLPSLFLYSYVGESFQDSIWNTVFIIVTILATGIMSLKVWNKLKSNADTEKQCKIS